MSCEDELSLGFNFNDAGLSDAENAPACENAREGDLADAESNADQDELDVCQHPDCLDFPQVLMLGSSMTKHTTRARAISSAQLALPPALK